MISAVVGLFLGRTEGVGIGLLGRIVGGCFVELLDAVDEPGDVSAVVQGVHEKGIFVARDEQGEEGLEEGEEFGGDEAERAHGFEDKNSRGCEAAGYNGARKLVE